MNELHLRLRLNIWIVLGLRLPQSPLFTEAFELTNLSFKLYLQLKIVYLYIMKNNLNLIIKTVVPRIKCYSYTGVSIEII